MTSTDDRPSRETLLDVAIALDVAAELAGRGRDPDDWDPRGRPEFLELRGLMATAWLRVSEAWGREAVEIRARRHGPDGFLINVYVRKDETMGDAVNLGEVVMAFVKDKGNPSVQEICRMLQDEHQYGPAFGAAVVAGLRDRGRIVIDEAAGTVALAPGEEGDDV